MKNDDKLSLPSHSYQSSSRQPNNYSTRPTYYSSSAQNDYSYTTQQPFPPPSNPYPSNDHNESGVPNGGSSERIINPSPLSFITAPVNGIQLQCLLDTGASNTFIHTSTLSKIRHNPIKRIKGKYTLADGNTTVDIDGEP
ncbi:unnamed protein product [Rotaria sp. Silwood2]|nr:unnamed protein product [Rotaria sp. Silwood2]CAF4053295.1 unnamed protein product [Rotaria sp. Silwood2]